MSEFPDTGVGYRGFTYTQAHLQKLRECLHLNGNHIALGVLVFMEIIGDKSNWFPWVDFAEKILADPEFPEKHFDPNRPSAPMSVFITTK